MKQVFFIIATLFIISCSNDESKNFDLNDTKSIEFRNHGELFSSVIQKESTNKLTNYLHNLGVYQLNCNTSNGKITYKLNAIPNLYIKGQLFNLNDLEFVLEENVFYEINSQEVFILKKDGNYYLNDISFNDLPNSNLVDVKSFLLLNVFSDILGDEDRRESITLASRGCSVSNQVVVVGWGMTSGGANADLSATIHDAQTKGKLNCWQIDSKPTSSNYSGIFYTSSLSFCCDGSVSVGTW